ncbi:MAG TPA: hypothetical protein VF928_09220 [Usitatibacteraceae bacterium]
MFKIVQEKNVTRTVTAFVPGDGTASVKATFRWSFVILPKDENDRLLENQDDDNDEWLTKVNRGFQDVVGDDNQPFESNDENFKVLINIPYARVAMIKAYFEAAVGGDGKRKNS